MWWYVLWYGLGVASGVAGVAVWFIWQWNS